MKELAALLKTKTVRLALLAAIGAVYGYWTGEVDLKELVEAGYLVLTTIFLRHGIEKSGPTA